MKLFFNHLPATTDSLLADFGRLATRTYAVDPPADIEETATHYALSLDVPGFAKEDIRIEVKDGLILFSGERKEKVEESDRQYHLRERPAGRFEKSFRLGAGVEGAGIKATFENGVLRVTVPKTESAKPRTIAIE